MRTDNPASQRKQNRFNQHLKFLSHHPLILNLILLFVSQSTYSKIAEEPLYPYVVLQKEKKILLFVFLVQTL